MHSSEMVISLLVMLLLFSGGSTQIQISTPDAYTYQAVEIDISVETSFTFEVEACNDAHVLLMKTPGDENNDVIEAVIGGWRNTRSVIRTSKQQMPPVASVQNTPVDCDEFKPFWIRWTDDGIYEVGYGLIVGTDQFLSYDSQSPPMVNAVAISTGWGATGTWLFHACAAGETDEYAYCKSVGALKSCDVGLGDVKVTHAWPKTILAGSCVPEQDYGYSTDKVWANNGCELIFSVCLANDCVGPQEIIPCDGSIGFQECNFTMEPGTLISVSIDANPAMAICNPLGFSTNPLGYPLNAPGIYGHDDDSMFTNSGCSAFFKGCFAEYACVGGEIRTVVCKSPNNALGYKACRVGDGNKIIRDAWLVTPRSPVQCNYFPGKHPNYQGAGGAWGYHDNILWTAKGCNSMFGVCLDLGCPGGKTTTLNCSAATGGGYNECSMSVPKEGIILYSQVVQLSPGSTTTCLNEGLGPYDPVAHNTSLGIYGWQHDKVWVNKGCSGEFEICYKGPCEVRGDPHITTTDGKRYSYHGACTYQLVHDISRTLFIYGDFFKCGHRRQVSCLAMTIILYAGHNITLEREQIIHVDGVVIPISSLPFVTTDYHVQIELVGGWIKVELSCGVYLMWDQVKWIDIYLPITFQGRTMGLCGTYDINIYNDFMQPNGKIVKKPTPFGNSWQVPGSCPPL